MIKSLQGSQSRVARIVTNRPYDYCATSMLIELGWPSLKNSIFKEISVKKFEALKHDVAPSYLNELF